jgi:hypothetical protein
MASVYGISVMRRRTRRYGDAADIEEKEHSSP